MSQVDNEQLNNIVQDAVTATANAHQKYINALEQRLKDKDAEIDRLKNEMLKIVEHDIPALAAKQIADEHTANVMKYAKAEAVRGFAKMLRANKIKGEFAQRDDYYGNVINIDQLEEIAGEVL